MGEVIIAFLILVLSRRINDTPSTEKHQLDFVGSILSVLGLGLAVFGVLRSSVWGWVTPKPGGPSIFRLSPVAWLILAGLLILWVLFIWENRLEREDKEPLVRPSMFRNRQLVGGLTMFLFQYFIQAGIFFTIPLFLSIVLELSALQTGIRLVPLSLALLVSALAVPRLWPKVSPRRVVRVGLLLLLAATVLLITLLDANATASIVTGPLLIMGLGIGALASQLGAVTVSSVPDKDSSEVGGLQNTALNLGASLGTALVGSVMIATLTSMVLSGVLASPSIPDSLKSQAQDTFGAGIPFVSDTAVSTALEAQGASSETIQAVLQVNADARIEALRTALFVVVIAAALALFFTRRIPTEPPGSTATVPEEQVVTS